MISIADQLPPEIARQLHPDRRKNEAAYWAMRDQLLEQYQGQWVGFADGRVVASGSSPVAVFHAAEATGLHPFFICVGKEEAPCRIRSAATLACQVWAWVDGQGYPCRLQADFVGGERILGRDVLNRLEVQFRGPVGEVVGNP
jgi:hypothetical protein